MKKHILLAKQGFLFKIISIVLQMIVTSPLFLLLSFIISSVIIEIMDYNNSLLIFKLVFIFFNILWFIRNSIVKVYNDRIIVRDWIGAKQTIETKNINSLKIISYKEARKMVFSSSGINPLITNVFVLIIPIGKFITFKNNFNRDVLIGVWNYKKLYNILYQTLSDNIASQDKEVHNKNSNMGFSENSTHKFLLKMPLSMHIVTFFKKFYDTLLFPLLIILILIWLFSMADIEINIYLLLLLFLLMVSFKYYRALRVIVNTDLKVIKLNIFLSNNKNVIKYENIFNLNYADSPEALKVLKNDKSKFCILTPYYKSKIHKMITFELPNDVFVELSVNKPQDLYDLLYAAEKNHFSEPE